jgi:hypothetical protein
MSKKFANEKEKAGSVMFPAFLCVKKVSRGAGSGSKTQYHFGCLCAEGRPFPPTIPVWWLGVYLKYFISLIILE